MLPRAKGTGGLDFNKNGNQVEPAFDSLIPRNPLSRLRQLLRFPPRHQVLQPRQRKNEQRCEHVTQKKVDPDQGCVKRAQTQPNPQRAQRSMCLQRHLPLNDLKSKYRPIKGAGRAPSFDNK
jgi:hypothetical protein